MAEKEMQHLESIEGLREDFLQAAQQTQCSREAVEQLRLAWLGRKGEVARVFASLRHVPREQKAQVGKAANELKGFVEDQLQMLQNKARKRYIQSLVSGVAEDVSLPVASEVLSGGLHPVTLMRLQLEELFRSLGFVVCDGPELELDFYNFAALNIPDDHPARDMQDTFYVRSSVVAGEAAAEGEGGGGVDDMVLRTQTSNIQIHVLKDGGPPVRIVAPGRVFRLDYDPTHTPLFHQIEGLVVDRDVSLAHLKGMVEYFLKRVFGSGIDIRFRPSYFPFVEPGAEVDIRTSSGGNIGKWLEVGGCGMVHPNVFETVGYDSEEYSGYAFGFGLDRLAMMAWGLKDLRKFFLGECDFHADFPVHLPQRAGASTAGVS